MTLPVWPVTVPATARDGWQMGQMYVPPLATDMEGGNQRLRGQAGGNVALIDYPLSPLTLAQWADFDVFVRTTLFNGTSRFTMPLVIAKATVTKTVQFEQGKSPKVRQEGEYMHVTLSLRVFGM